MNAEEKRLRERGEMIDKSYIFWDKKVYEAMQRIDDLDKYEDTIALELEEELQCLLERANFEKREMDKLEKDIRNFVRRDEEKKKK